MRKNVFTALIAAIALLLIAVASNVTSETGSFYMVSSVVLMAAYTIGQYRFGKSYR
ncbi:MAG: hypothetical protein J6X24_05265 [Firmicutes bacterium]|nr:hypothetical protein [Bacillota bacterium]